MEGVIISLQIGVLLLIGHLWCFCSMFATPVSFKIVKKDDVWKIRQRFRWYVITFVTYPYVQTWNGGKDAAFPTREKAEAFLRYSLELIEMKRKTGVSRAI